MIIRTNDNYLIFRNGGDDINVVIYIYIYIYYFFYIYIFFFSHCSAKQGYLYFIPFNKSKQHSLVSFRSVPFYFITFNSFSFLYTYLPIKIIPLI
jgi:hypothetical protein